MHRDLKPGNLLLESDFTVRIADMGTCKLLTVDVAQTLRVDAALQRIRRVLARGRRQEGRRVVVRTHLVQNYDRRARVLWKDGADRSGGAGGNQAAGTERHADTAQEAARVLSNQQTASRSPRLAIFSGSASGSSSLMSTAGQSPRTSTESSTGSARGQRDAPIEHTRNGVRVAKRNKHQRRKRFARC
jgi:serine/threonine protein kinase